MAADGRLDHVARDRRAPGVGRRVPVEVDHRRAEGGRRQGAGRPGGCVVLRRGVHECRGSRTAGVHRSDPVAAGNARLGGRVAVLPYAGDRCPDQAPTAATREHVDLVACDCAPAVRGRCVPVEVDDRRASGRRTQVLGFTREPGPRRGGVRERLGPVGAVGVHRPDPVVAGDAHRETRVRILVLGRARSRQPRPRDADIRRHVHLITGDRVHAGGGRWAPGEVDGGRPGGGRRQCTRCPRAPRCCGARDHVRVCPRPFGVDRGDAIVLGGVWLATAIRVAVGGHASVALD